MSLQPALNAFVVPLKWFTSQGGFAQLFTLGMAPADLIWNRACEGGGPNPCNGDLALAALLKAHGLAMNGGVLHAVECLSASEMAHAESGYRYSDFGAVADLLFRARKISEANLDLESYERQLDDDYAALIPDDSTLFERFESLYRTRPSEFACL